jgi:predicted Abi (CAAX) family protease
VVGLLAGLPHRPLARADAPSGTARQPAPETSYALAQQAPFNRPDHYPLDRRPDPSHYRPHATWMGRLILPQASELDQPGPSPPRDWVWLELEQAPGEQAALLGRRLRLTWRETPELQGMVRTVTTDIRLAEAARAATAAGNVVPTRLDGRRSVGPLLSLAGARPHDDITVELDLVQLDTSAKGEPLLRIGRPPVQITGRWTALAQILGPEASGSDRFRARHFDSGSGRFDGPIETVRIPTQPPDRYGRRFFDPRGIATTPVGREGWYLHGSPDSTGLFTVQALEPRLLTQVRADRTLTGTAAGLRHILHGNWRDTPLQRGLISRVALWPDNGRRTLLSRLGTATGWQIGDEALLIHGFGGIGGVKGEPIAGFTVTGHFAFGQAQVIADPFSGEPRFAISYHQIYANNPNGIVAGTQDWSAFSGDLQRGWLGTRPISDVLVEGDGPLLRELAIQAEVLMARYRSGDGTGVSTVTPATSCVQDSFQALFISIDQLRRRALASPAVRAAVERGGNDADELRRLGSLARSLKGLLTPFGMVRPDWRRNASLVEAAAANPSFPASHAAGITDGFSSDNRLLDGFLSWRSMLPRRGHDDLAQVFLRHGSPLWILRTNQIPGSDPRLEPLAPTLLFGQIPPISTLLRRFSDALFTPLTSREIGLCLALLGTYAAVVLPAGFNSGFLCRQRQTSGPGSLLVNAAALLVMPALGEELLFRVALLPHPLEGVSLGSGLAWGALSVGLFTAYHPLAGRLWYARGRRVFSDQRFLLPCALLGVICVIAYQATGSLWPPLLLHWIVVLVWLEFLDGRRLLTQDGPAQR